jgi:hypothetical protein
MAIRTAPWAAIAALLLLLAAAPARAQLVNENLLVGLPPGYKVGWQDRKPNLQMSEMVPAGETVESWTEMVTVQIFFHSKSLPQLFRARINALWAKACPNSLYAPVAAGPERGYPAEVWMQACPSNPKTGKPEHTFFKAIQGNDSLYVVQKAFKYEPSRDEVTKWTRYLKSVSVCDSRIPDRACPAARN